MQASKQPIQAFKRAMRRQRFDEAQSLLVTLPESLPSDVGESVGLLHLIQQRWQQAALVLRELDGLSGDMAALRRFAMNMATLQAHRPALFAQVASLAESDTYVVVEHDGRQTIAREQSASVSASYVTPQPSAQVEQAAIAAMQRAEASSTRPVAALLVGMGDGYGLQAAFARPANNDIGALATLHVIEPDLALFKANLLLHDWSADDGLLAAERVVLCVGPSWQDDWRAHLQAHPDCPLPTLLLRLGLADEAVVTGSQAVIDQINQATAEAFQRLSDYYDGLTNLQLARAVSSGLNRAARVLWLTSRYSSVVRYSAADAVDGLQEIGVRTELLMESADHHQITSRFLVQKLEAFKPDVLMTINYLRGQFQNGLPSGLPVFTWLQDEVSELMSEEAGQQIDHRQFIGTCSPSLYTDRYGYPARQMMYLDKLTRVPSPLHAAKRDPEVVFVSNAARTPARLKQDLLDRCADDEATRLVVGAGCDWLIQRYEQGGCCQVAKQLFAPLDEAAVRHRLPPLDGGQRSKLAMLVFNSVNNTLYRQQGLRWARRAAESLGLRLALYGQDWDQNPEFADCDRGYAAYGEALEAITQRATFNLQIVPFNCIHQRLLDGWAAGGFYLIRDHPSDRLNELWQSVFEKRPTNALTMAAWRAALSDRDRAELEEALRLRSDLLMDAVSASGEDVLQNSVSGDDNGFVPGSSLPPLLKEVTFDTEQTLMERMQFFMANADARDEVLREQQYYLRFRGLRYCDGMRRVMEKILKEFRV